MVDIMLGMIDALGRQIALLDQEITRRAKEKHVFSSCLITNHGIGPITATALSALAPVAETFRKGRDLAAWLGLTPQQKSTGGMHNLGATSNMGERTYAVYSSSAQALWFAR